jgi:hypothetical protein
LFSLPPPPANKHHNESPEKTDDESPDATPKMISDDLINGRTGFISLNKMLASIIIVYNGTSN